jgi:hypothetical protein
MTEIFSYEELASHCLSPVPVKQITGNGAPMGRLLKDFLVQWF